MLFVTNNFWLTKFGYPSSGIDWVDFNFRICKASNITSKKNVLLSFMIDQQEYEWARRPPNEVSDFRSNSSTSKSPPIDRYEPPSGCWWYRGGVKCSLRLRLENTDSVWRLCSGQHRELIICAATWQQKYGWDGGFLQRKTCRAK